MVSPKKLRRCLGLAVVCLLGWPYGANAQVLDELVAELRSPDPIERARAATEIGGMGPAGESAADALIDQLSDRAPVYRRYRNLPWQMVNAFPDKFYVKKEAKYEQMKLLGRHGDGAIKLPAPDDSTYLQVSLGGQYSRALNECKEIESIRKSDLAYDFVAVPPSMQTVHRLPSGIDYRNEDDRGASDPKPFKKITEALFAYHQADGQSEVIIAERYDDQSRGSCGVQVIALSNHFPYDSAKPNTVLISTSPGAESLLALAAVAGDDAVNVLIGRLVEPVDHGFRDRTYLRRRAAATALGSIGDRRAVEPLIAMMLQDREPETRLYALNALLQIDDPRAIEPLIDMLKARVRPHRKHAWRALVAMTGQDFGKKQDPWSNWWNANKDALLAEP